MARSKDLPSTARQTLKEAAQDPRLPKAAAAAGTAGAVLAAGKITRKRARGGRRSYRLLGGESIPDGARRVARGRIDHALDQLRGRADGDREAAIHEVRKDLKKLRALLRLFRGELGGKTYRQENTTFRGAGRSLSGARDSEVMLQTLESLESSSAVRLPPEGHAGLKRDLELRRDAALEELHAGPTVGEVRSTLKKARSRVKSWPLRKEGFAAVEPGLRRSYKRGRRALQEVERDPTTEALHEWRKRVKDLWYHLRLLAEAGPAVASLVDQADVLADRLGEDHDLAVLNATAAEWAVGADAAELEPLRRAIEARRSELQAQSLALGRDLYVDRPRAFTRRLGELWAGSPALAG